MQPPRFSFVLRQGFEDVLRHPDEVRPGIESEPDLAGIELSQLPRLVRDPSVPLERQDRAFAAILRCYRLGPAAPWAAVLLEALAPSLVMAACGLAPVARALSSEDVEQDLVAAALRIAGSMPLPDPPRRIQRRLTMRASWEAMRAVAAAARKQSAELDGLQADESDELDHQLALFELAEVRADFGADPDLDVALRAYGYGESFDEAGRVFGLSGQAARSRCRRLATRMRGIAA